MEEEGTRISPQDKMQNTVFSIIMRLTLYGNYISNAYAVTFDANGGDGEISDMIMNLLCLPKALAEKAVSLQAGVQLQILFCLSSFPVQP